MVLGSKKRLVSETPYEMSIDLRILNHLGIHLYSNVAAVLSEAVANAWDADARKVSIDLKQKGRIVIADDGCGMNLQEINGRFLNVGYDKRKTEGDTSTGKRTFMGRKGIGKLSLFSIADMVEIHTVKGSERHSFQMSVKDIKKTVGTGKKYRPKPIQVEAISKGTKIVLTKLKPKRTSRTPDALRKRVARRFSIIGYKKGADSFAVVVNDKPVSPADREDLKSVEFLWEFGTTQQIPGADAPALKKRALVSPIVDEKEGWKVKGWIGAVPEPKQLASIDAGAMNNVIVLSRGRLIQENVLDKINFSRLFANYLTGQIEAEFLDISSKDDIATSDRQRMIEDDERYQSLLTFLRSTLVSIADNWTDWRNEARGKDAVGESPTLAEWLGTLPAGQRIPAQKMLGVLRGIDLNKEDERKDLYKSGILAFERLRLREEAHRLGEADILTASTLLPWLHLRALCIGI